MPKEVAIIKHAMASITDFAINVNVTVNYNATNIKVSNGIIVGY